MKKGAKTILMIEDNKDIAEAMDFLLRDEGYNVIALENGKKMMSTIHDSQPDIILVDMLLSGTDGRELILTIKNNKKTQNIPVILTSAHPNAKNIWKKSKADDFIAKPFDIEELDEVLQRNFSAK